MAGIRIPITVKVHISTLTAKDSKANYSKEIRWDLVRCTILMVTTTKAIGRAI